MTGDVVTLDRAEYTALVSDAEAWRALKRSEHVVDLLHEWHEWRRRRDLSAATAAMSSLESWHAVAGAPTFTELERRRRAYERTALTPDQIKARAAASWAAAEPNVRSTAA
ncbi:hypothetical protein GCM10009676_10240 [Prauserella halophila]|uniref:DUF3263 domain-containing protein n=1 Tax=Prauserella halophila TaxID=185641 RepID=A0ABN1W160_9PSEU|nr:hypothetical protein [Prauserella halophila]MCP2235381.1 hypothetical protein [Prauserella halophila]